MRAAFPAVEEPVIEVSSDSLDSSGTMLADPEASEDVSDSDSVDSESPPSRFAGGAFAALLEDEEVRLRELRHPLLTGRAGHFNTKFREPNECDSERLSWYAVPWRGFTGRWVGDSGW